VSGLEGDFVLVAGHIGGQVGDDDALAVGWPWRAARSAWREVGGIDERGGPGGVGGVGDRLARQVWSATVAR
jgi:hypothetical protein